MENLTAYQRKLLILATMAAVGCGILTTVAFVMVRGMEAMETRSPHPPMPLALIVLMFFVSPVSVTLSVVITRWKRSPR
ncbi:MAG: hypothetical protein QOJ65_1996 [Fimbriimonadaceae bacterium]|nr:hypothetical protein [Fimbriimonadaceae bacterium]